MKTDIEIAKEAKMLPITDIAKTLGIRDDELELYGHYKAKINDAFLKRTADRKNGKLILHAYRASDAASIPSALKATRTWAVDSLVGVSPSPPKVEKLPSLFCISESRSSALSTAFFTLGSVS